MVGVQAQTQESQMVCLEVSESLQPNVSQRTACCDNSSISFFRRQRY